MKKIYILVSISFLILSGCASNVPLTIPEKFDRVVVANFSYSMEDLEPPEEGGKGKIDILSIKKAKEIIDEIQKTLKDSVNTPFKLFLDSVYSTIVDTIRNGLNIPIQPLQQKENEIQYDLLYGFPQDDIKLVARKGKFDAVMAISIHIKFLNFSEESSGGNVFGVTNSEVKRKPELTLKIEMVDKSEKLIWRERSAIKSKEWITISTKSLWGVRYEQNVVGLAIVELTKQAVQQLVKKTGINNVVR